MALHLVLALALVETLVLAGVLLAWAQQVAGARLLTVFLLGVAVWIVGNELPNWLGPGAIPYAMPLLATIPLTSAAFLHFCFVFCRVALRRRRQVLLAIYGIAAATTLLTWVLTPAEFIHFPAFTGVDWVVVPLWPGWVSSLTWAALAGAGVLVLLHRLWASPQPQERRQVAAVALSCGWGLACMSGYGFAALQIPLYPWQVLALPAYPVILVYGILRYQVFVANAWARRALAWTLLLGLGLLAVPLSLLLPLESRWLSGLLVAAICLTLNGPVRRFAERIVYPGGTVTATDLQDWRQALGAAGSWDDLAQRAAALLSRRVGLPVDVQVGPGAAWPADGASGAGWQADGAPGAAVPGCTVPPDAGAAAPPADAPVRAPAAPTPAMPILACGKAGTDWQARLLGWDAAPPGPRRLAELFAGVLAEAAAQLEHATMAEQRERERQLQARLAELGALAASVAHDLRNPLNIIAMAVALAPAETRREVGDQVGRISRLAEDLLDYAKPWQVRAQALDAGLQVREAVRRLPGVELGPGLQQPLPIDADPLRLEQALANLLANARAAAGVRRVHVDAERTADSVELHVCDDGAGVPADLRERVFEPFASRSPGGTGLGLAIVARIMAAHGGSVRLQERAPWTTCFTLAFPAVEAQLQPMQAPGSAGQPMPARRADAAPMPQ